MAGSNEFVPFAYGGGAYVEAIATWIANTALRSNGLQPGIILGTQLNRALRQGTAIGPAIAAMMANVTGRDVLDDGVPENFWLTFWLNMLLGNSFADVGGANAVVVSAPFGLVFPAPVDGLMINVKIAVTNTGASTLNWMGTGPLPIRHADNSAISAGDLLSGGRVALIFAGASWQLPASSVPGKQILLANADFYVAPSGNDTTGTGAIGAPWLTIQHAYDYISTKILNFGAFSVTIHVADGTYTGGLAAAAPPFGGGLITILGNISTPANVIINTTGSNCFTATNGVTLVVSGFTMVSTISAGAGGAGLAVSEGGNIYHSFNVFAGCQFAHIFATFNGIVRTTGNYSVSGNAPIHWYISGGGRVIGSPTNITITTTLIGAITFANAYAVVVSGGQLYVPLSVWAGPAVTGKKFDIQSNGIIDSAGNSSATYLPGSIAGTTSTGGVWV